MLLYALYDSWAPNRGKDVRGSVDGDVAMSSALRFNNVGSKKLGCGVAVRHPTVDPNDQKAQ